MSLTVGKKSGRKQKKHTKEKDRRTEGAGEENDAN